MYASRTESIIHAPDAGLDIKTSLSLRKEEGEFTCPTGEGKKQK